jgi:hypothetical protein
VSAFYRVRQFLGAAGSWIQPEWIGHGTASRYLSPEALGLFESMPRYDRRHALKVVRTLEEQGYIDPDLLAAALLHDAGKTVRVSSPLRLWHRVAVVLMRTFWPGILERIGQDRPGSWRYAFLIQQHHAAISGDLARQAGCSEKAAGLILRHEDVPRATDDPLLTALRAADNAN